MAISLDFESFSILTRALNILFFFTFGGLGWSFHAVRGNTNPGDIRFRPPVVGVVDAWKDVRASDGP